MTMETTTKFTSSTSVNGGFKTKTVKVAIDREAYAEARALCEQHGRPFSRELAYLVHFYKRYSQFVYIIEDKAEEAEVKRLAAASIPQAPQPTAYAVSTPVRPQAPQAPQVHTQAGRLLPPGVLRIDTVKDEYGREHEVKVWDMTTLEGAQGAQKEKEEAQNKERERQAAIRQQEAYAWYTSTPEEEMTAEDIPKLSDVLALFDCDPDDPDVDKVLRIISRLQQ